jgi:hypothetical protein
MYIGAQDHMLKTAGEVSTVLITHQLQKTLKCCSNDKRGADASVNLSG